MSLDLVVLAAGMGNRFGGLKQVEPVGPGGELLIEYGIHDALEAGFTRVIFVIRREIEDEFRRAVGSRMEGRVAVDYVFQELDSYFDDGTPPPGRIKPWGTGHAALVATSVTTGPFAVINADDYYGRSGFRLLAESLAAEPGSRPTAWIVGYPLATTLSDHGTVSRGVCEVSPEGVLRGIREMTGLRRSGAGGVSVESPADVRLTGDETVSLNFWGFPLGTAGLLKREWERFRREIRDVLKDEFYLPEAVGRIADAGEWEVRVRRSADRWFGVTHRDDLAVVRAEIARLIEKGAYPERLGS